jgi:hypothetical protein
LNALAQHPKLIRRSYWTSRIEILLEQTDLTSQDRRRLHALRDMPGLQALEYSAMAPWWQQGDSSAEEQDNGGLSNTVA